ncbi:Lysine-specific permease [Candidatus Arsenophonus lipoptenae]|uniref:Lysine-specific permease n=1 Tax=Candidatus Arsenophonus lipoptenae TaxID=634113 RepID=A0A109QE50_9GAMM|nr:amino acid permease [Candidatus Arsenophonus lipoptenae]AMA64976.1 Lysine-specific permease [Candidatus Arsenophonus lipoptenae]
MSKKLIKPAENTTTILRQELKSSHLIMIAIGGSIGTGLFIASGATIAQAGPGGALVSYVIVGLMVYFLMTSLGELAAYLPISGSFATYGSRYVDDGFGFALGWNYWYNWAITIAVDLVAVQLIMEYWFPKIDGWVWSTIFLIIIFIFNYISIKGFAEAEYWFSLIKIITVIIFIIIGLLLIIGSINHGLENIGWHNWKIGEAPFVGGLSSIIGVSMIVGFSFQGTELIGVVAAESKDPYSSIPKAVRQVFWRILLFYVLSILVISLIIPYWDPRLLCNNIRDINISPFALVFKNAGLVSAANIMNIVILIAVLSSCNSGMYASTRMLYNLAKEGKAPKIFSRLSSSGVPRYALFVTATVAGFCFLSSIFGNQVIYLWLLNTSGITGFIAWLGIAISHYRFRKGYILNGYDLNHLPYLSVYFPIGPIFAFIFCLVIIFGQNYQLFLEDQIDWYDIMTHYFGIFIFLIIWFCYKIIKKTHFINYRNMNFSNCDKNK